MVKQSPLEQRLTELVAPSIEGAGFGLVCVRFIEQGRRTLQIMIERNDELAISVDDCADVSRALSVLLDVEDPIQGEYDLEVSSPGIDRPLVCLEDFKRFKDYEVSIVMDMAQDGRKRFSGKIVDVIEDSQTFIRLACRIQTKKKRAKTDIEEIYDLPYEHIARAKLVITDELLDAAMALQASNDNTYTNEEE